MRQAALTDIEAAVEREAGTTTLKGLTGRLGSTTISGAGGANRNGLRLSLAWDSIGAADLPLVFRLLGTTPPTGLVIEGDRPLALDLVVDAAGSLSATGRLAARRVSFGTLALSSLESPLRLTKHVLTLDPLTFTAYGGAERGRLSANIAADPVAWRAQSRLQGLDLNAFLNANTSARDKLSGTAQATANLTGSSAAPLDSMKGTAAITVSNGVIRNFAMLGAINSALKIAESAGNDTRFERLSATLAIGGRRIATNDLQLVAGQLTVNGAGTITFDQRLALNATAVFSRAKSQELIARVRELSGLKNDQGQIVVPLSVTGTASAPRFQIDLGKVLQRAAEKELKRQLDRGLKRLFKIPPP
jgi:hypothetical protein